MIEKTRPICPITPPDHLFRDQKTPITCKAICRVHRSYKANPTTQTLSLILHANIKLAAIVEIHKSINKGLIESI